MKCPQLLLLKALAVLWVVHLVNMAVFGGGLFAFGIRPLQFDHLMGVAFAPFLHRDFDHLLGNSIALVTLGGMVLLRGERDFFIVTVFSAVLGGLVVLFLGAEGSVHAGASGVIYGYFGFLVAVGIVEKKLTSLMLSAVAIFLHWKMIFGVLPGLEGVSWEGHLSGFVAGIIAARKMRFEGPAGYGGRPAWI